MTLPFHEINESIRTSNREKFARLLSDVDSSELQSINDSRYSSWFSGIGATLLQLVAFLKPSFVPLVLDRGVEVDLHSACAIGDTKAVERILSKTPNAMNDQVDTYFPIQFSLGQPEILRHLLEQGDDPNRPISRVAWFEWEEASSDAGFTWKPFHMLALGRGKQPHTTAAGILKQYGGDPSSLESPIGDAPIHLSAIYGRAKLIEWFVTHGCDVDQPTRDVTSPAAKTLYDRSPYEPFDGYSSTPLMLAAGEGQVDSVATLLRCGASVHATDSNGFTPLHYAAGAFWGENVDIVTMLLAAGASPNTVSHLDLIRQSDSVDKTGCRPRDLAILKNYTRILRCLS